MIANREWLANLAPGPVNLDGLDTADLYQFTRATRGVRPYSAARVLFPRQAGAMQVVRDLKNYAWNAITARACRERGEIQTAQHYESICERIYNDLPEYARW